MSKTYFEFRPCFGPEPIQKEGDNALCHGYTELTDVVHIEGCTNLRIVIKEDGVVGVCSLHKPEDKCLYGLVPDQTYPVYVERNRRKRKR